MKKFILLFLLALPIQSYAVGFNIGYGYSVFEESEYFTTKNKIGFLLDLVMPSESMDFSLGVKSQYFRIKPKSFFDDIEANYYYYNVGTALYFYKGSQIKGSINGGLGGIQYHSKTEDIELSTDLQFAFHLGVGLNIFVTETRDLVLSFETIKEKEGWILYPNISMKFKF